MIFLTWIANRATHPRDVSRPDVDRYRNWLGELVDDTGETAANGHPRYAPATIARKLAAVRSLYNYLAERRAVAGSPAAGVKSPTLSRDPRGRAITELQVRLLLETAAARGYEAEAIVRLLVLNGLRVSEVCVISVGDIQREPGGGRSLMILGKGGKRVPVPLNAGTERAVVATVGARVDGPRFAGRTDGACEVAAPRRACPTTARRCTASWRRSLRRPASSGTPTTKLPASTLTACATPS